MTVRYPPPWQDISTLCEHLGVPESLIETLIARGALPAPVLIGGEKRWKWARQAAAAVNDIFRCIRPAGRRIRALGGREAFFSKAGRDISCLTGCRRLRWPCMAMNSGHYELKDRGL
jgi:hypothetical protein